MADPVKGSAPVQPSAPMTGAADVFASGVLVSPQKPGPTRLFLEPPNLRVITWSIGSLPTHSPWNSLSPITPFRPAAASVPGTQEQTASTTITTTGWIPGAKALLTGEHPRTNGVAAGLLVSGMFTLGVNPVGMMNGMNFVFRADL